MNKLKGVLIFLGILYAAFLGSMLLLELDTDRMLGLHKDLLQRIGLLGIVTFGAGLIIITGNIDLSIGSQVALCATVFCMLVIDFGLPLVVSLVLTLLLGTMLGAIVGLAVTKLRVQSFIVTLCGMFIFRGIARLFTGDKKIGLGQMHVSLKDFFNGDLLNWPWPTYFLILFLLLATAIVFLHRSVLGRYMFAIGSNERAAWFAGINVDRFKIAAFAISSTLVAFYSFLFVMKFNSVNPNDTGTMRELYAIAGAVLGGCSLRGGDGSALGLFLGACIIEVLYSATDNLLTFLKRADYLPSVSIDAVIPVAIGLVLLGGAVIDERLRRQRLMQKG